MMHDMIQQYAPSNGQATLLSIVYFSPQDLQKWLCNMPAALQGRTRVMGSALQTLQVQLSTVLPSRRPCLLTHWGLHAGPHVQLLCLLLHLAAGAPRGR